MGEAVFNKLIRQTEEHVDTLVAAMGKLDERKIKSKHTLEMIRAFALMSEASAARKQILEKLIEEDGY
jgi:hypothetical protein